MLNVSIPWNSPQEINGRNARRDNDKVSVTRGMSQRPTRNAGEQSPALGAGDRAGRPGAQPHKPWLPARATCALGPARRAFPHPRVGTTASVPQPEADTSPRARLALRPRPEEGGRASAGPRLHQSFRGQAPSPLPARPVAGGVTGMVQTTLPCNYHSPSGNYPCPRPQHPWHGGPPPECYLRVPN